MRNVDIQNEVKDLVNFTSGAANQDFTSDQLQKAINLRYKHEVAMGQQQGQLEHFHKVFEFTWASGAETLVLPSAIDQAAVLWFEDITSQDPGTQLNSSVFWKDNRTLQWGDTSPGSDVTIRAVYLARATDMLNEADEPELIAPQFRMLLVWSTACYLRIKADEAAPAAWKEELTSSRLDWWKHLSRGRPYYGRGSHVSKWPDTTISGAQADQDGSSISQDNN